MTEHHFLSFLSAKMPLLSSLLHQVIYPYRRPMLQIALMSILAQVLLIAGFVLPWQILQILTTGHSRLDNLWFARADPGIHIRLLILIAIILGCFLAYAICNILIKKHIRIMSRTIIDGLNKTKLMDNHRAVTEQIMRTITRFVASATIVVLFSAILAFFYPILALAGILCVVMLMLGVHYFYHYDNIAVIQSRLQGNLVTLMNIGLAVSFIVILYDYTQHKMQSFLVIFLAVMVVRQILTAGLNMIVCLLGLHKRHQQINMLLLPRHAWTELNTISVFEERFFQENLLAWVCPWLSQYCPHAQNIRVEQCKLLYRAKVAHLLIYYNDYQQFPDFRRSVLLKCYTKSKENDALHEIDLLSNMTVTDRTCPPNSNISIMPTLLAHGAMSWCFYLLLDIAPAPVWLNSETRKPLLNTLRRRLFHLELPQELMKRYDATFLSLPEKMARIHWQRMNYLSSADRAEYQLDRLIALWPEAIALIRVLPRRLTINNPDTARMIKQQETFSIYCWQGWVYDTVGVHWPLTAKVEKDIAAVANDLWQEAAFRALCPTITTAESLTRHIILAARCHEFCRRFNNKNDSGALNMIQNLIKSIQWFAQTNQAISTAVKQEKPKYL